MSLAVALIGFSAAIELAQMMVTGRHARLSDFLTDAGASCFGAAVSLLIVKFATAKREY
jgi:VanZ family protein